MSGTIVLFLDTEMTEVQTEETHINYNDDAIPSSDVNNSHVNNFRGQKFIYSLTTRDSLCY